MYNIGLLGKRRAGKDTAAAHLVATRSYTRLAFADPLKEMALRVDPWITYDHGADDWLSGIGAMRLSEVVRRAGWERAKDEFPEVRRLLQNLGQAQREFDEHYWVNALRRKLNTAERWNLPVVVTDVRYRNEAEMLRARGFRLIRIVRTTITGRTLPADQHASETELDDFSTDAQIINAGSIHALNAMIAAQAG